jgi:hypothetical protein
MDSRPILTALIQRLEPLVGHLSLEDFAYWGKEPPNELLEMISKGFLHLTSALENAKMALTSGELEKITTASLICPTLERTGREKAAKHARLLEESRISAQRAKGGRNSARTRSEQAKERRSEWTPRIEQLLALRKNQSEIARILEREMLNAHPTEEPPSNRTLRAWVKNVAEEK